MGVLIAIGKFFCVVLAIGVGTLLWHSAGAIALLLLWPLLLENMFNLFGSVVEKIMPFLAFMNANHLLGSDGGVDFRWGPWAA